MKTKKQPRRVQDRISGTLQQLRKDRGQDKSLLELESFFKEMTDAGLVRKQEYGLPQVDTVGKSAYSLDTSDMRSRQSSEQLAGTDG